MLVIKNYVIDEDKIHAQIQENKLETPTSNEILEETKQIPTKSKRRKRGRELTLDD